MSSTLLSFVLSLAMFWSAPEPRITGVAPDQPTAGPRPQALTVTGENFRNDLSLMVTVPGGTVRTMNAADISSQRSTSFQVSLTLEAAGAYALVVLNGDGGKSQPFALTVKGEAARPSQPGIDQIAPEMAAKGTDAQVVTLTGRNFATGLKISVTDPTGTVTVADAIDKITPQAVVFKIVLDMSGRYEFMVTNPSGESSSAVAITVR